jgi:hypothetical protein
MTPQPALATATAFVQTFNAEDYEAPLPSFVGIGLAAYASDAELGALADRAEAGVSALQLIFSAQAAGAVELPVRLADQLRALLDRATGQARETAPSRSVGLALIS